MSSPINSAQKRPPGWLAFWWVVATLLGIWPALTNGLPFIYFDTTAYMRGADLAISKVLGSRFATDWAKDQRRTIQPRGSAAMAEQAIAGDRAGRRVVLAGRSIIYGALLYFGELLGGMWFSVLIQSFVALYLVFVFIVRVLGLDFRYFLVSCGVLLLASPLPFFASFLMPDVFAGLLILAFAILATSWGQLGTLDRSITCGVLLFAVLSHTTHLGLLLGLTVLTVSYAFFAGRSRWIDVRTLIGLVAICVAVAVLWEAAFSFAVRQAFGIPPIRPPFVTAKLVSMLGAPAVSKVCGSSAFAVCRFQDRFPVDCDSFLWSEDERRGVFSVADAQTKQLLDAEQLRFALAIIPPNLGRFVFGTLRDAFRQLTSIGLSEYSYEQSRSQSAFLKDSMPSHEFGRLTSTLSARSDCYAVFGNRVLYPATVIGAVITLLLLWRARGTQTIQSPNEELQGSTWRATTCILFAGIILNAAICGGLSALHDRYEARVIWLIQLSAVTGICASTRRRRKPAQARTGVSDLVTCQH